MMYSQHINLIIKHNKMIDKYYNLYNRNFQHINNKDVLDELFSTYEQYCYLQSRIKDVKPSQHKLNKIYKHNFKHLLAFTFSLFKANKEIDIDTQKKELTKFIRLNNVKHQTIYIKK